tara:strand:+ start:25779 stop:26711 length:933 start_codon:yes stop_codon:yes gene_type:complete
MKYTNDLGLPQPIVDVIVNDDYDAGDSDISVTSLIAPAQKVALEKLHKDEIVKDVSEEIYALMGKTIHNILEKADNSKFKEQRLFMDVNGWKVSGQFDRINISDNALQDYKISSVWEYIHGIKQDRIEQLNCYAALIKENTDIEIKKLEVIFIFRDWSKSKAKYDGSYPQNQIAIVEIPLWESNHTKAFMELKVEQHKSAQDELNMRGAPECTDEERWKDPTKHAVVRTGNVKASRVLDTAEEAEEWLQKNNSGLDMSIEVRHGKAKRCENYCHAAPFCNQYKSEMQVKKIIDSIHDVGKPLMEILNDTE